MAEQTLKPCPFCGSSALDIKEANPNYYVVCRNCGAEGPEAEGSELACSHWNTRAIDVPGMSFDFIFISINGESKAETDLRC
jgi:Lar family restriction alleviation protein